MDGSAGGTPHHALQEGGAHLPPEGRISDAFSDCLSPILSGALCQDLTLLWRQFIHGLIPGGEQFGFEGHVLCLN